jgi:hypothetical protein
VDIGGALVIVQGGDKNTAHQVGDAGVAFVPEFLYFLPAHFKVEIPFLFRSGFMFFIQEAVGFCVDIAPKLSGQGEIVAVDKMGFFPGKEFLPPPVDKVAGDVVPFRAGVFPGDPPLGLELGAPPDAQFLSRLVDEERHSVNALRRSGAEVGADKRIGAHEGAAFEENNAFIVLPGKEGPGAV